MTRLAARVSPEIVAAVLSVAVIALLVGVRVPGGRVPQPGPSATPRPSVAPSPSDRLSAAVRAALETVVLINGRLVDAGHDLEGEHARANPRAPEIAVVLPRIVTQTTAIGQQVTVLVADPLTASLGADLVTAYGTLADLIRTALRESVQNQAAYTQAAKTSVELIAKLKPLTVRAQAILRGALETATPPASPSVGPTPSGSGEGSPEPSPASAPPSAVPSAAEGGLIVNAGFEAGPAPWVLRVVSGAAAQLTIDKVGPGAGVAAARVDISTGTDARSGISLVQTAVPIRAGQTYLVRLMVRAAEGRDVGVRLSATNGDAYVARVLPVTTTWTTVSFTFDALADDPAAELGIDLGRSAATVWIDGVALSPVG
jgi:hypothetical protein